MDFNYSQLRLVIFDSIDLAGDNGEYFYRKIRELHPEVKMVFLLSKKSPDWNRLKNDGFNLYPIQGPKVDQFFRDATYILFSKSVLTNKTSHWRAKSIFLQHGTINRYHNLSLYFKSTINYAAKYICCSSREEGELIKMHSKNGINVIHSGLPRHDVLLQKWNSFNSSHGNYPKQIFISFHWRCHPQFRIQGSNYLSDINSIISSMELKRLVDDGVKVVFYPHAMFRRYLNLFKVPGYIEVPTNKPFQDILVESDCLVTDFSSNSFEMAYMNKPTFAFVPGIQHVNSKMKQYNVGNLSTYKHITYCNTKQCLYDNLFQFVSSDKTCSFAQDIFENVDQYNSERLFQWMVAHVADKNRPQQNINARPFWFG